MKIAFFNPSLIFDTSTPYHEPLGGSESAICYLSEQLSNLEHEVIILSRSPLKVIRKGVTCLPTDKISKKTWEKLDVLVIQNAPLQVVSFKKKLNKKTKLVLWTQHAFNQPAVQSLSLAEVKQHFDAYVLISKWQQDTYISTFNLKPNRCTILKNAVAPAFEKSFKNPKDLISKKQIPPVLAYTSTPFRGLDLLIKLFPIIRQSCPDIILKVYSSMKVYQVPKELDQKEFGKLYDLCKKTKGVIYYGSVPQPQLAEELSSASILAYPNTFAETSCIAVMEAMSSGCQIITSDLGALSETTAGFGKLIPTNGDWTQYSVNFVNEVIKSVKDFQTKTSKIEEKLFQQVKFANTNYSWAKRATEWDKFLTRLYLSPS